MAPTSDNRNYRAVRTASSGRDFDDTSEIRAKPDSQRTTARSAMVAQLVAAAEMN